ncbi:hypothetical protein ESZ50_05720 [Weissella muntiaci]|uniref:Uncharacterized protein n=1 Tax=Weissella muntiaci TaxID=2508881 RepID=A0A6C2C6N8_9LACO|nr:hypothetical protein [Weissella muntiaci]TYC49641.1 hypothetical protein ESZ50_05720 [Weissella muntiaci]
MDTDKRLIRDLRLEYGEVSVNIMSAKFALATLSFKTEEDKELLRSQLTSMENYASYLLKRAGKLADRANSEEQ